MLSNHPPPINRTGKREAVVGGYLLSCSLLIPAKQAGKSRPTALALRRDLVAAVAVGGGWVAVGGGWVEGLRGTSPSGKGGENCRENPPFSILEPSPEEKEIER